MLVPAVVLVAHGLMNTISTRLLSWLSTFSAAWHILGSIVLVRSVPAVDNVRKYGGSAKRSS